MSNQDMKEKIKSVQGTEQGYSAFSDKYLWSSAREIAIYMLIFVGSGYVVKNLLDSYIAPDASQISDKSFE